MKYALGTALTEQVCLLLDQFQRVTDTRIVFYDPQGHLLKAGLDCPDCLYCTLIQRELHGEDSCQHITREGREAARGKRLHCYQCPAGLMEVVIPIHSGGYLLGYAMIGQIRTQKSVPAGVMRDWARRRGDARLRQAYLALPLVAAERLEAITSFLSMLVDSVVSNHMLSLQGDSCVVTALEFMRKHLGQPLTLPEVARAIERSPFSVSHAFRRHLQTTFRNVLTEMRLTWADELFSSDPALTVAEVSRVVGFDDPFYFSRVYRKHRGEPPSELLRRLRGDGADV